MHIRTPGPYSIAAIADEPYRRVGGLMLLLCFFMVVASPVMEVLRFAFWTRTTALRGQPWSLLLQVGAGAVVLGLSAFSCVAGVLLWRVHKRGRGLAIGYFVVEFGVVLLLAAVVGVSGALRGAGAQAFTAMIPLILPSAVRSGICVLYLATSRRVRRTHQLRHGGTNTAQPSDGAGRHERPAANPASAAGGGVPGSCG